MTMQQFCGLTEMEQMNAIMQYGRLMAQHFDEETRVFIYRIHSFFVCATYSPERDELTNITACTSANLPAPHLRKFMVSVHPAEREYETPHA